jgi:hypothetical protein
VEDRSLIGMSDEDLLEQATAAGRCLVTANVRDFAALHSNWASAARTHAGLVYVVNRVFPNDRSFVGAVVTALERVGKGVSARLRDGRQPGVDL